MMNEKMQINLYLPRSNVELLDSLSTGLEISRSQTVDLLLRVTMDAMGKHAYEKATKSKELRKLVEGKLGIKLLGTAKYEYKSLS